MATGGLTPLPLSDSKDSKDAEFYSDQDTGSIKNISREEIMDIIYNDNSRKRQREESTEESS